MFNLHFDKFGNLVEDSTQGSEENDPSTPRPSSALKSDAKVEKILTTTVNQLPAYDSSAGPSGISQVTQNADKTKEIHSQSDETDSDEPTSVYEPLDTALSSQGRFINIVEPATVVKLSPYSNQLEENIPQRSFCSNSVNKRLPLSMRANNERNESAGKQLAEALRVDAVVDKIPVAKQVPPILTPPLTRAFARNTNKENNDSYLTPQATSNNIRKSKLTTAEKTLTGPNKQHATSNIINTGRAATPERKRVTEVQADGRSSPGVTHKLATRSLPDEIPRNRKIIDRSTLDAKSRRFWDVPKVIVNQQKDTCSDNILQSLRRQVEISNSAPNSETSKTNPDCNESVVNITLLSFGIQNKGSTSSFKPNGKQNVILSNDSVSPEINRLLSQLTEYMIHQQQGDGVGTGESPAAHEFPTLSDDKKISASHDEKELSAMNYRQSYQVYRMNDATPPRSKPPCGCSETNENGGNDQSSNESVSESDASDRSVSADRHSRNRRTPHTDRERRSQRHQAKQQESFHSDSREIGMVDYEKERSRPGRSSRYDRRRRESSDVGTGSTRFKNEPSTYPVKSVNVKDDRVKQSERRRYSINSSGGRSRETAESRDRSGSKGVRPRFDFSLGKAKDVVMYDDRYSKRRVMDQVARRRLGRARDEKECKQRASTAVPHDESRQDETDEDSLSSMEEVVIRRYSTGRKSVSHDVEEPRRESNRKRRPEKIADKTTIRIKDDARQSTKVSGRKMKISDEWGSNESIRGERRLSNGYEKARVDEWEDSEEGETWDGKRRSSNKSATEPNEDCRRAESRTSSMNKARNATTFETYDVDWDDSAADNTQEKHSHRANENESHRLSRNGIDFETPERTGRHESKRPRKDLRRSAHFEDDVDASGSRRNSIDEKPYYSSSRRASKAFDYLERDDAQSSPRRDSKSPDYMERDAGQNSSRRASKSPDYREWDDGQNSSRRASKSPDYRERDDGQSSPRRVSKASDYMARDAGQSSSRRASKSPDYREMDDGQRSPRRVSKASDYMARDAGQSSSQRASKSPDYREMDDGQSSPRRTSKASNYQDCREAAEKYDTEWSNASRRRNSSRQDFETRNGGREKSSRLTEATSSKSSDKSKEASSEIPCPEKSTGPTGQNPAEEFPTKKRVSKTRQMLKNALRFGKHPIQTVKTRKRTGKSSTSDGTETNDKTKDSNHNLTNKLVGLIAEGAGSRRDISVMISSTHAIKGRKTDGVRHRTSLRRGDSFRIPSSNVIINRSALDSASSRYGAYIHNKIDVRKTVICGDEEGVIDIRNKKLKQCFCGQGNQKSANTLEGCELLCACEADKCRCSPGNKRESRKNAVPKQQCSTISHGDKRRNGPPNDLRSSSSPHRPCERRRGDATGAVILVRAGKYLEVDVSGDKIGKRTCGRGADDSFTRQQMYSGRHGGKDWDGGRDKSGRHRDSLASNSSELTAYRQGSSSSMFGADRDNGLVDKRYNIAPSKHGDDATGKHGEKDGYDDVDGRLSAAMGRGGRSRSGRGADDDEATRLSKGGRGGKSRSGRGEDDDEASRLSTGGRGGKSRTGRGEDDDEASRLSKGGRGGKSRSGRGEDDDEASRLSKGGRGGKSRSGRGEDDDEASRLSKGGRGGKSRSGRGEDDDEASRLSKGGRGGKSRSGRGEDDDEASRLSKGGRGGKSRSGREDDDEASRLSKGGRGGKSRSGRGEDDDEASRLSKGGRGGKSRSGREDDDEASRLSKGGRGGKSRSGRGEDDDDASRLSKGERGGKSRSGRGEDDDEASRLSKGGRGGKSRSGRGEDDDEASRLSKGGRGGKSRSGKGEDDDEASRLSKGGRGGQSRSGRGEDDDEASRLSKGGRGGKSRSGKGEDDDEASRLSKGGRGGKSRSGRGEDDDDVSRSSKGGRGGKSKGGMADDDDPRNSRGKNAKSKTGKEGDDELRKSKGGRREKSGSGLSGDDDDQSTSKSGRDAKSKSGKLGESDDDPAGINKKGSKKSRGSVISGTGSESEKSKLGRRDKKSSKSDKETQAELKASGKGQIDSGTSTDDAKGKKKKKKKKRKGTRGKRDKDDRQEGGMYHGLVMRTSQDDPSVVMNREHRK